jgi:hypothetical protein
MLFSDPNYILPQIEALRPGHILSSGTTLPMVLEGVDRSTYERGQYVIKFWNANRMSKASSGRELIASWIAMEFELPVVTPVIIHVSQDFADSLTGREGYKAALQSLEENFGSQYKPGFEEILTGQKFSNQMVEMALRIYAFDLFITNPDRGHQKNNVNTNGSDFLIFDHELAFSYISMMPFLRSKTPWIFSENDRDLYSKHVFYKYLKGAERDFSYFSENLERLNDGFWQKAHDCLPLSWKPNEFDEIRNYLSEIVLNKEKFADQLTQTLL